MVTQNNIFPIAYFPPVHWFAKAITCKQITLEVHQHFRKQQLTNRMHIRAANRILALTIPIQRRGSKTAIKDKKISYAEDWRKQHLQSLISAYRNSPYFIYYEEELAALYQREPTYLLDFLMEAFNFICKAYSIELDTCFTQEFQSLGFYENDFRDDFDPGLKDFPDWFMIREYTQVFGGFSPGLSILDLLFNEGRTGLELLRKSIS